ncbi:MAG TPA: CotH kinase family protein [Candidatus Caccoplasma merdavium]|nr:CotH kinase family protein [Candidatus Caccoplasma merdavium]
MKRLAYLILLLTIVSGCSEEEVKIDIANCTYSRTLPVLFINTEENKPIVSKEEYINATYYLETFDLNGYEPIGSEAEQLPLEIRGRGNSSWNKDKKPYRLKLGSKATPLGMNKSKHFVLLAHVGAYSQYLTETAAFELGKEIGLAWTPEAEPVEVVVNNEYKGLYFLVENIRVDDKRVNITEQDDNCTNADEITGGWLLEIDNYNDPDQIKFVNGSGYIMHITHKSPEILSKEQESYLRQQMKAIDDAVYADDKNSTTWEKYIDIDALARYYIIQEIFCNGDAFAGSSYFYKNRGNDTKWIFGPLWDFGNSFEGGARNFFYEKGKRPRCWIKEIAKYPRFQEHVRKVWNEFYPAKYEPIYTFIAEMAQRCAEADKCDAKRWPQYNKGDTESKKRQLFEVLQNRIDFLNSEWSN